MELTAAVTLVGAAAATGADAGGAAGVGAYATAL
jgi:hypothetical protein